MQGHEDLILHVPRSLVYGFGGADRAQLTEAQVLEFFVNVG